MKNCTNQPVQIETLERYAFYERCRNAYVVVAIGESTLDANVILFKKES
ncbi:hypothetical protein HQN89_34230 [Paenibacillus frigoriresistens]|nr:hypothetical protein [Paenibacillus frigoriresistens]